MDKDGVRVCGYCAFGSCFNCKPTLTYYEKVYVCECKHDFPDDEGVDSNS